MDMQVKREGRCLEIYLKGELDHHGAKGLMARLDSEIELTMPLRLVLDFGGITFMDSSGIAVVMRARQRVSAWGGTAKLRNLTAQPKKVLDAAGLGRLMEMEWGRKNDEE